MTAQSHRMRWDMDPVLHIHPIGVVCKRSEKVWISIDAAYQAGLSGLGDFSHIDVLYWLHLNDTSEDRKTLQVRPRKNPANPLTGVFATRSPQSHCADPVPHPRR